MKARRLALRLVRLVVLAASMLIAHAPAQQALAHASLVSAQPEDGAVLAAAPERLILIFNEPVAPLRMQLVDPLGRVTPLADVVQHDATVILPVPRPLDQGTHVLSWRVVSSDGHPVGGTLIFSVGEVSANAPMLQKQSGVPLLVAIWVTRIAIFIALFFGLGGAVFANWIAAARPLPGRTEKLIAGLCAAGLLLLPLSVGLQGLDALELPLSALGQGSAWQAGFGTTYGTSALMAALALAAAWISMTARAGARIASLLALAAAGLALAASGHAAAAAPQWLTRPAVWMHVVAVALWIGSLWPLAALLCADGAPANAALRRFTIFIPWAVAGLIVSGGMLAVIQLARVDALWTTSYGMILSAKLAVAGALFALAAANRFFLTRRVEAGDAVARRRLGRSIAAEIALVLLIFGLVAGWRFTPPPRAIATAEEASEFIHFHAGKAMADLTLEPGRVGRSSGEIMIRDGQYQPLLPKGVTLIFSQPAAGIEPLRREAVSIGDYRWRVDDVVLLTPGRWHLRIDVLIDDFEQVSLEDDIFIRP